MPALEIEGQTYPDLLIPNGYRVVVDQLVPRNGQQVHLRRYQPAALPQESLNREHVTVLYGDGGHLYSYNALTQPLTGPLPDEQQAYAQAEKIWHAVDPDYRQQLDQLRILDGQTRSYVDASGKTVTIPLLWAKYANTVHIGSYEWIGFGPGSHIIEFERENYWDYATGRQKTEMWYGDDWVKARRGIGPQLRAPLPLA